MPELILEVLSLEILLPKAGLTPEEFSHAAGAPSQQVAAEEAEAKVDASETHGSCPQGGIWCEIAPAWDSESLCFATDPRSTDEKGRASWTGSSDDSKDQSNGEESPEPLVAMLITVPPPGGIAALGGQCLSITVYLAGRTVPLFGDENVLKVPLRQIVTSLQGQPLHVSHRSPTTGLSATAVVAWLPAPAGVRQLAISWDCLEEQSCSAQSSPSRRQGAQSSPCQAALRQRPPRPCRPASAGHAPGQGCSVGLADETAVREEAATRPARSLSPNRRPGPGGGGAPCPPRPPSPVWSGTKPVLVPTTPPATALRTRSWWMDRPPRTTKPDDRQVPMNSLKRRQQELRQLSPLGTALGRSPSPTGSLSVVAAMSPEPQASAPSPGAGSIGPAANPERSASGQSLVQARELLTHLEEDAGNGSSGQQGAECIRQPSRESLRSRWMQQCQKSRIPTEDQTYAWASKDLTKAAIGAGSDGRLKLGVFTPAKKAPVTPSPRTGQYLQSASPAAASPRGRRAERVTSRRVFKEDRDIDSTTYTVEIAASGRTLAIAAHNPATKQMFSLLVDKSACRRPNQDIDSMYEAVAKRLYFKRGELALRPVASLQEKPTDKHRKVQQTIDSEAQKARKAVSWSNFGRGKEPSWKKQHHR
eukprot:gnl/TRDRNA2_/TRDRNA2_84633_c0_seq1.p1 gnl/TRDRNA2_/TRDRNA2_84633_c0~~gnl/TRDRNA2_/TRDRNA2_84633_c0_seq1.p1  ORF type:complete len:647 (+),score=101.77 gnl/TRDRNA2_/TRDRNA2_84633_c0_seq1:111-2051(+)